MVGEDKLQPHPDKIKAVADAPRPVTKRQVGSLLGLIGFYRKFVPNFLQVAATLTDATRKGQPNRIIWGNAHENAFRCYEPNSETARSRVGFTSKRQKCQ